MLGGPACPAWEVEMVESCLPRPVFYDSFPIWARARLVPTLAFYDSFHSCIVPTLSKYDSFHFPIMPTLAKLNSFHFSIVPTLAKLDSFHFGIVPTLAK